jgi:tape measure domain-containing protein
MGGLVVTLELQQEAFQKGMDQAAKQLARSKKSSDEATSALKSLESRFNAVTSAASKLAAAFATFKSLEAIATVSDNLANLQGSFTALTGSVTKGRDLFVKTFETVGNTGASLDAVSGAMQRLTIAMAPMGASNSQVQTLAENFVKLGRIGGSSMEDTANGLRQLGQALASGTLGGDELKSIRENVPLVAKAIADGLGVPVGKLKELGEQGKLTSDVVANSLLKVTEQVNAQFAAMPRTLEQATNQMKAQSELTAAKFNELSGIGKVFTTTVDYISGVLKRWGDELSKNTAAATALQAICKVIQLTIEALVIVAGEVAFWFEQMIQSLVTLGHVSALLITGEWTKAGQVWADNREQIVRARKEFEAFADAVVKGNQLMKAKTTGEEETGGLPSVASKPLKPPPGLGGAGAKGKSDAEREAEALAKRGEALAASVSAQEAYNQKMREYDELLGKNAITQKTFELATAAAKEQLTAAGDAMRASVDPAFAYELAMRKINQAYADGTIEVETWVAMAAKAKEEMDKTKKKSPLETLRDSMESALGKDIGDFFKDMISGSMTVADAFNKMVKSIITDLGKLLAEFAAKEAAKFIISSLFGGGKSAGGKSAGAAPSMALATMPTWNAAGSLSVTPFATPRALAAGDAQQTGGAMAAGGPWNVVINNNAAGVEVSTRQDSNVLEVTVQRVRALLSQDVLRGGNSFSRSLESAYALGRGR